MRRICLTILLMAFAAAARAGETAERPYLVLQTNGHTAPIRKILYTPEGKRILTVSEDKTIRVWDAHTGERLGILRPPVGPGTQGELRAAALSPDGKTLAVGGLGYEVDGKHVAPIYLIDLAGGRISAALQDERMDMVHCLAFSPDGKRLASGGDKGTAFLWDVGTAKCLYALEEPKGAASPPDERFPPEIQDIAFSPNGKLLAMAFRDKTAWIWSAETGQKVAGPLQHESFVNCVAWRDDNTLATAGSERIGIHLWDHAGNELRRFDKPRAEAVYVESLAFVPGRNGAELFYAWTRHLDRKDEMCESGGSFLNLDNPEKSRDGFIWTHHTTEVRGAVSPNGKEAATSGGGENRMDLWAVKDGKHHYYLRGRWMMAFRAYWGAEGRLVAWDHLKKVAPDAPEEITHKAFDLGGLTYPSGKGLKIKGAVHAQGNCRLERLDSRTVEVKSKQRSVKIETRSVLECYTLLSGDRLVAAGAGSHVGLYDARTGRLTRELGGHFGKVWDLTPSPDGRYLLAAFSDTLRIYDPEKEEPLLSLFVAGPAWVAWTQEGYYAASPAGEKMMGWQVNHGLDAFGTFYPAEQFHKAFYRPDIIQRVLAEGSVALARAAADKAAGRTTEAVDVAQALPPEAAVLAPAAGTVEQPDVEVKASAESKSRPVVSLRLLLDGRPFPGAQVQTFPDGRAGQKQEASWKVQLPEGEHGLAVLAESDLSSAASAEVKVAYQPKQETPPTLYLLAVGIDAYPGSLKLNWATDDATAIQKAFTTAAVPRPFGKVQTKLLTDAQATREGILGGLDWLRQMTADDTAVVFYAGHGHRDRKTGQFYLLPQDVDVSDLDRTGVTGTQLKDKLKAVPGRVLVLLDACHSGSIGQSPADPAALTDDVQRQLAAPDCGVVILCAAMAQEEAGEAAAVKHGFFTAALLKGLGGAAPAGKDGLIHLTALNYYVEEEVAELSKDEQHVVVDRPSTVTSFPLVKASAKAEEK